MASWHLNGFFWHIMGFRLHLNGFFWHSMGFLLHLKGFFWHSMGFLLHLKGFVWHSMGFCSRREGTEFIEIFPGRSCSISRNKLKENILQLVSIFITIVSYLFSLRSISPFVLCHLSSRTSHSLPICLRFSVLISVLSIMSSEYVKKLDTWSSTASFSWFAAYDLTPKHILNRSLHYALRLLSTGLPVYRPSPPRQC